MNLEAQQNLVVIEGRATYERITSAFTGLETEEAIGQIVNFLKIYPEFAQAHNDLAVYYYKAGNSLKALAHYEKAHKLAPRNITFLKNLADFYLIELDWADDAIHIYLDILKDNPFDIEALNALGAISLRIGRKEQSRQYYSRALQLAPASRDARQGFQMLGLAVPQVDVPMPEASSAPETVFSTIAPTCSRPIMPPISPSCTEKVRKPEEFYQDAAQKINLGQTAEAMRQLEDLVSLFPDFAPAHNDLGVLCQQAGKLDEALRYQERAASIAPENSIYQKNLADLLYLGFQEYEKALTVYVRLLSKNPKDIETLKAVAHVCLELGKADDAGHFLERILAIQPWDQDARTALKKISENKTVEASQASIPIGSPQEAYVKAQQLVGEEKFDQAVSMLEQLVSQHATFALAHNDLGVLKYRNGDLQGALNSYENAVKLEPANAAFKKNLADLFFVELGRTDEAIGIYLELLRQNPRNVETLENLGHISKVIGRPDEAKTFYRRALEIEPWNAGVREALRSE